MSSYTVTYECEGIGSIPEFFEEYKEKHFRKMAIAGIEFEKEEIIFDGGWVSFYGSNHDAWLIGLLFSFLMPGKTIHYRSYDHCETAYIKDIGFIDGKYREWNKDMEVMEWDYPDGYDG